MKVAEKRLVTALTLTLVFTFLLIQMPAVYSQELNVELEDEGLSIITDAIGLDLTKYDVELYKHYAHSFDSDSPVRENIVYTLDCFESKIRVALTFINQTLVYWSLSPLESSKLSPIYSQPLPTSQLDVVKESMQRYQAYSKATIIQEARNILDTVTEIKTMNTTVGNLKMRITDRHIDWIYTLNGVEYPTGLSIRLNNGVVDVFMDESSFYRIDSADVNISQEEAIRIAWEKAKTYTSLKIWMDDTYEIVPFSLVEDPKSVQLQAGTKETFVWSPYWYISFGAEKIQYGINGVVVSIRADTGEISYSQLTGYLGSITGAEALSDTTFDSETSESQLEDNANPPLTAYVVATIASIIAIIAIATLVLKKRSK